MSDHTLDSTLAHYGVRGMRWGHRKSNSLLDNEDHKGLKIADDSPRAPGAKKPGQVKRLITSKAGRLSLLVIGTAIVKEILTDSGSDVLSPNTRSGLERQQHEDFIKDMQDRDTPMFNPKARLDPSQVRFE